MVKRLNQRRAGRILLGIVIAVVVIVAALGGAGYVLVRRTLPQTRGTIHIARHIRRSMNMLTNTRRSDYFRYINPFPSVIDGGFAYGRIRIVEALSGET